jgi:asparagine synthase (glutamine-hydrolysing)
VCGIAGIHGHTSDDRTLIQRMTDRLEHRGPDEKTVHLEDQVALGHTRLAIIDRSGGHEPFTEDEDRTCLVYNGEIYNHKDLREDLEKQGHGFQTKSDGEIPLHLLREHDDPANALRRLDGMFAFAHWDPSRKRLLLARDPYGIKPLYYTATKNTLLFASEIKALLAHPLVDPEIDPDAVREKSVFEYLLPGTTWFKGIKSVPPGHYLTSTDGTIRLHRYHEPRTEAAPKDLDEAADRIHTALSTAVKKQLMSEVPLGVILSGGLDSSLIAALQTDHSDQVLTFSAAWSEDNADFQAARLVADHLGTKHHETLFTREDMDRDLAHMVWSIEDIDHETYFFHPLFRMTREHATVGLCGQGADEVFGGYPRYHDLERLRADIRKGTMRAWPDEPGRHDGIIDTHYQDLKSVLAWERGRQMEDFQLRLVDRSSMAFSTEVRVPFLDEQVVAIGRSLPTHMLIDDEKEKIALRAAARRSDLPKSIIDRKKIPAGRSTGGDVIASFKADAERSLPPEKRVRMPYGELLDAPSTLMLRLFTEIFIENRGRAPRDLQPNDLL